METVGSDHNSYGDSSMELAVFNVAIPVTRIKGLYGFMKRVYNGNKRLSEVSYRRHINFKNVQKLELKRKRKTPLESLGLTRQELSEKKLQISPPVQLEIGETVVSEICAEIGAELIVESAEIGAEIIDDKSEIVSEKDTSQPVHTYNEEQKLLPRKEICKNTKFTSEFDFFLYIKGAKQAAERRKQEVLYQYLEWYEEKYGLQNKYLPCNIEKIGGNLMITEECECGGVIPNQSPVITPKPSEPIEPKPLNGSRETNVSDFRVVIDPEAPAPPERPLPSQSDDIMYNNIAVTQPANVRLKVPFWRHLHK